MGMHLSMVRNGYATDLATSQIGKTLVWHGLCRQSWLRDVDTRKEWCATAQYVLHTHERADLRPCHRDGLGGGCCRFVCRHVDKLKYPAAGFSCPVSCIQFLAGALQQFYDNIEDVVEQAEAQCGDAALIWDSLGYGAENGGRTEGLAGATCLG